MAGFLDKIFSNISFKQNKSVLGIDISSSSIKIVQVRKERGSAILETYGELALGPYTGLDKGQSTNLPLEKMSGALLDLLKESNVTTKNCGVAIPMSSSLINIVEMPDVGKKRLETMIPIEMRKYIPVPISEVLIDWRLVPKDAEPPSYATTLLETGELPKINNESHIAKTEVFVVAIHKETIENYTKIMQDAGLSASFFEIEIFSTIRTISAKPGEAVMIIDFGAATTKVYIIESGIVRDTHTINRGSQDITLSISKALGITMSQAEEIKRKQGLQNDSSEGSHQISTLVVDQIFNEANRVLLSYQKKFNKNIPRIVLTGGGSILRGLMEVAKKDLVTEVEVSDPFSNLQYPAFLESTLKSAGPEFAVAIGVALRKLEELE
jgi:type IV pilus assembly protein PilM